MSRPYLRTGTTVLGILLVCHIAFLLPFALRKQGLLKPGGGVPYIIHELTASESSVLLADAEHRYWVGDVSGLHSRGGLAGEIAEADLNPIIPLREKPHPFGDYYVVAMNSGPSLSTSTNVPTPLQGLERHKEMYSFCIVPSADHPNLPTYIISPVGVFRKMVVGNKPVLDWPLSWSKDGWSIVD